MLTLEVTERVFVRDEARALIVLDELKDIGVKLALDDFGTGYSSLGYLETLPIDTIKIDQTFVAKLTADPGQHTIVSSIIQLAHGLGMTVVAEGVETAEQHQTLTSSAPTPARASTSPGRCPLAPSTPSSPAARRPSRRVHRDTRRCRPSAGPAPLTQ